jgi:ATP-binding cassette subfamily B protein
MPEEYYEEEEYTSNFNGNVFRRILGLVAAYKKWVFAFLVCVALVSALDSIFTYLGKQIIDQGIVPGDRQMLINLLIIYGVLALFQSAFVFGFIYLAGVLGERVRYDLRQRMFNHLQALSLSYYSRTPVGWIVARVTSDSDRVSEMVTWGMLDSTWGVMNILTALGFMLFINWRLALIVLAMIPILFLVAVQFQRRILREYRQVRKFNSKITGAFNENISGVRVVKALGREPENMREFSSLTGNMYNAAYRAAWVEGRDLASPEVLAAVASAVGLDGAALVAAAPNFKAALVAQTDEAVRRGAFGAPTFFVGEELFVGNDRLDFVEETLRAAG